MKLTKEETKEYINLQLPIIKGELQQANSKINTFITIWGIVLTASMTFLGYELSGFKDGLDILTIVLKVINTLFAAIVLGYSAIRLVLLSTLIIPEKKIKVGKNKKKDIKIDIYNLYSYTKTDLDSFLKNFSFTEKNKGALIQIYLNSELAIKRYSRASKPFKKEI